MGPKLTGIAWRRITHHDVWSKKLLWDNPALGMPIQSKKPGRNDRAFCLNLLVLAAGLEPATP
jgi:hypothetical protein